MRTKEGAPAGQAESPNSPSQDHRHTTTARAFTHGHRLATAPQHRRWTGRPRRTTVLSDVAVWTFYFLLTAAGLMALCVLLTLVWPTP